MDETGADPQAQPQAELDRSGENLLRFIRLEFAMAETVWAILKQTENKRQRKRLRDDIRKAKVSITHFKKKLRPVEGHAEANEYLERIEGMLQQSGTPSVPELILERLGRRVRKLRNRRTRNPSDAPEGREGS